MARGTHVPVLLERCLELLRPALAGPGAVHVDATLGLGGHAEAVLEAFPEVTLVGIDRDPEALALAADRLGSHAGRTHLVHAVYNELAAVLDSLGISQVNGVLFDLGVSSLQLDAADRGFAYSRDAPLDMRMDPTRGITAAEVLNTYAAGDLTRILRVYGEEKFASRIAAAIVREREKEPFASSARLADLVRSSIPAPARRTGGNPAKRTFQALRIEVNAELSVLEEAVPAALDALAPEGRIAVLSYHSLEDRLVKQAFAGQARSSAPIELPVEPAGSGPTLRLLTRGAEVPDDVETATNPRAASARLRAAERIPPPGRPPRQVKGMHQPVTRPVTGRRRRYGTDDTGDVSPEQATAETAEHRTTEGVNSNDEG